MNEYNDNAVVNDPVVSSQSSWLRLILVALLTAALTLGGTALFGAYDHTEIPPIGQQLSDGQFDSDLLVAQLKEQDLSNLSEYVRPVSVNAVRYLTEQEVLDIYNESVQQFIDNLNAQYNGNPPESTEIPELAKSFEDLPQQIKDRFNEDGLFPQQLSNGGANGFLLNGKVAIPSRIFQGITVQDNVRVDVKLLADPSVEDQWKEEVLFSGSAPDLVDKLDMHSDVGLAFIARPDNSVLTPSDGSPYEARVLLEELSSTNAVVYGTSQNTSVASVLQVVPERNLVAITGAFSGRELGMPVFALRDGNLVWLGVIVTVSDSHTAVVVSAATVEARSEGGR